MTLDLGPHALTLVRRGRECVLDATTREMADTVRAVIEGLSADQLVELVHRLAWLAGTVAIADPEDMSRVLANHISPSFTPSLGPDEQGAVS